MGQQKLQNARKNMSCMARPRDRIGGWYA